MKIFNLENLENNILDVDIIISTIDTPKRLIRRVVDEASFKYKKPVIFSGFSEHYGMVGPFIYPDHTVKLVDIEKNINENEEYIENLDIIPSYGSLCFLIASIISNEVLNFFIKYNPVNLIGKTLMINFSNYTTHIIDWNKEINYKESDIL